jgi:hypothetical protein
VLAHELGSSAGSVSRPSRRPPSRARIYIAKLAFIDHHGQRRVKRCASKKAAPIAAEKIEAALRLEQEVLDADSRRGSSRSRTTRSNGWVTS